MLLWRPVSESYFRTLAVILVSGHFLFLFLFVVVFVYSFLAGAKSKLAKILGRKERY